MNLSFTMGRICCICRNRFTNEQSDVIYKSSCICKECAAKLEMYPPKAFIEGIGFADFLISPFIYNEIYRKLFLRFKFNSMRACGHFIGMRLYDYFSEISELNTYDLICPVPLSKGRLAERGFNQSEVLAAYVSQAINIPVINVLSKPKESSPQSSLRGVQRVSNIQNAFSVISDISTKNIIIFDDIFTTGNTIRECARTLKNAGAAKICAITAARVYLKEQNPSHMV